MEEFRRSRSSSTLGTIGKTDTLEIHELPNGSSSEHGSVEPIISEATTPEPPPQIARPRDSSIVTLESAESSDNISQYLDKDREEKMSAEPTETAEASGKIEEKENVDPTSGMFPPSRLDTERAKSEEPSKRKRKLSIDSSYSRISLSKLAVLKKLKDAKEKIKVPKFSFRRKRASKKKPAEAEEVKEETKNIEKVKSSSKTQQKSQNPDKPMYIHIPLKPPPGETDEFSYLEFENNKQDQPSTSKEAPPEEPESTPDSPAAVTAGVQFIVLTPPSDDEILEDPHIPDTPSEGEKFFDNVRIEELKTLAKDVVDGMAAKNKKLATVEEDKENGTKEEDDQNVNADETEKIKLDTAASKQEKIIVDEEDGLRSSEIIKTESKDEPNKPEDVPPSTESQVAEKRRSFRKKVKKEDTDRIYEDVQVPSQSKNKEDSADLSPETGVTLQPLDVTQSMSVDEEKTYLDEKIIKSTSLEEDYNKWSKTK